MPTAGDPAAGRPFEEQGLSLKYRKEVDGLRALAVVPVILFHAGAPGFSGGYLGVDVFFVISGYLITGLILHDKASDRFSIAQFYERRARRILPALFVVTIACVPAAIYLMFPYLLKDFGKSLIAVWLFASNILFWRGTGYFNPAAEENPLLHTWSLAVEEQYYLVFPGLLSLFWFLGRRRLAGGIFVAACISLCLAEWGWRNSPAANFYLAPTRAWELFIGALLAFPGASLVQPANRARLLRNIGAVAGLLLIVASIATFNSETPSPGLVTLIPTLGAALIIACADEDTLVGRALGNRFVVLIGLLSYSLYLWHQPLFAFARLKGEPSWWTYAGLISATAVLAYFTWRYVETPLRNRSFLSRRTIFSLSVGAIFLFTAIGWSLVATGGLDARLTATQRSLLEWRNYPRGKMYREGKCFLTGDVPHTKLAAQCLTQDRNAPASLFLWGDSHAAHLYPGLARSGLSISQVTAGGCPPVPHYRIRALSNCEEKNDFVQDQLGRRSGDIVLLSANWQTYYVRAAFRRALDESLTSFSKLDHRFVLIGPTPQWEPSLPEKVARVARDARFPAFLESNALPELRRLDTDLERLAHDHGMEYVSLLDALCNEKDCRSAATEDGSIPMVWDGGHLTKEGSDIVATLILHELGLDGRDTVPDPASATQ